MADSNLYIQTEAELNESLAFLSNAFYFDKYLPNQVFKQNYSFFQVDEHWVDSQPFWEALQKSALNQEDELITVVAMDDKGIVAKLDSCYQAFKLSINASPSLYGSLMRGAGEMYSAAIIMMIPKSLCWALIQDHDFELAILGFNTDKGAEQILRQSDWFPYEDNWMSIETAITELMPQMYGNRPVPPKIAIPLCQHYGSGE